MIKQKLMEALKERGIAFDPSQKRVELEALLAASADPIADTRDDATPTSEPRVTTTQWHVYDHKEHLVRTYTVADHGDAAGQLAEQFIKKIGGTIQTS